jgi:hypothetical protein
MVILRNTYFDDIAYKNIAEEFNSTTKMASAHSES